MTKRFVVIGEAVADRTTARELADRVLIDNISWLKNDPELLEQQRSWVEQLPDCTSLTWKDMASVANKLRVYRHGPFNGRHGAPDAAAGLKAITVILRMLGTVDAIVLIRDADKQPERLQGLAQAKDIFKNEIKEIVLAVADPKRESWIVVGFEPKNSVEKLKIETVRKRIDFDPRLRSHELTGKRDAKQVLSDLTDDNWEREQACWRETPLDILRQHGSENGLNNFLTEVETLLVPLIKS